MLSFSGETKKGRGGGYIRKNDASQAEEVDYSCFGVEGVRNKEGRVGMKARNS